MENFVTIKTFTHPTELAVLRTRLEADGIECLVLDELTTQINPLYSNAIGGVRLQVKESDIPRTLEILKEGGYIQEEPMRPINGFNKLNNASSRLPFLKNLSLELRLLLVVTIGVLLLTCIIYFLIWLLTSPPSTLERLTTQRWCVDQVTYNGKDFATNTVEQIQIIGMGFCQENIDMRKNGTIILPGFNSRVARGQWTLNDNSLRISRTDTFDFVYNGTYDIDLSGNRLILKSELTTLYCHPENIQVKIPF